MTSPDLSGQQLTNQLRNGSFEEWASGVPVYWTLAGAGATIAKETTNTYLGVAAAAVTRAGANATLRQSVNDQTLGLSYLKGKTVSAGVWVRKGAGAFVRVGIDDGVTVEWSGHACHIDAWELVSVLSVVSLSATQVDVVVEFAGANVTSQVDAAILTEGEAVPRFTPNPADTQDAVNQDTTAPATPTGLAAASKLMSVLLTWTQNAESDVKAYEIQRADDAGFTTNVIGRRVSATTWTDEVNDSTVRFYRIRAVRVSEAVSAWTTGVTGSGTFTPGDTTAPAVPTGVAVTAGFQLNVVRWTPPADADWDVVEIWRSTSNDSTTATKVGEHRGIMWVDDKLANATAYYYWLKSRDTSGNVSGFHAAQGAGVLGTTLKAGVDDFVAFLQRVLGTVPDNLITNGGGEEGTLGSQATGWILGLGNILAVAEDEQRVGPRSLKVVNPSAAYSYSYQDFPVVAGAVYELSGWIKTTAISPTGGSIGAVLNINVVSGITSYTILEKIGDDFGVTNPDIGVLATGGSVDWTYVRCRFIPNGTNGTLRLYAEIGYGAPVTGTAWFDGIVVRRIYKIVADDITANIINSAHLRTDTAVITVVAQIANAIITTAMIQDAAIDSAKIGTAAITNAKIGNLEVDSAKIANLTVGTGKVAANAVSANASSTGDGPATATTSKGVLLSVTLSTDGGYGVVLAKVQRYGGLSANCTLEIRKDSTTGTLLDWLVSYEIDEVCCLLGFDASPGSTQDYKLCMLASDNTALLQYYRLLAINLKK